MEEQEAQYFIEQGFDGNMQDNDGSTALHNGKITLYDHIYLLFLFIKASSTGHLDIVKNFIEKGVEHITYRL